jgi:polyribonucleotide 5'-hydroxyl-kinase
VYFNAHLALEQLRGSCRPPPSFLPDDDPVHAVPSSQQEDETLGPRVLIVGEPGSGKSTVCKSLVNWAVRMGKARRDGDWTDMGDGRKVLFVNIDPSDVGPIVSTQPTLE